MRFGNQAGATLVESALILALLLPTAGLGLTLATSAGLRSISKHLLYEAVICVAEGQPHRICRQNLRKKLRLVMPFGKCLRLRLATGPFHLRGELVWAVGYGLKIKIHHQIPRQLGRSS